MDSLSKVSSLSFYMERTYRLLMKPWLYKKDHVLVGRVEGESDTLPHCHPTNVTRCGGR